MFPEADAPQVLDAARTFVRECRGRAILLGESERIRSLGQAAGWDLASDPDVTLWRGGSAELQERIEAAARLVADGAAAGMVAGAVAASSDVLRVARRQLFVKAQDAWISEAAYLATRDGRVLAFADAAITPNPSAQQLAAIARDTAETFNRLMGEPARVALLSFSTCGSASGPEVEKVVEALRLARARHPGLVADGELQFDAAFSPTVGALKAPGSVVAGRANVFIFPNLDAANIAYKVAQFLAGAEFLAAVPAGFTHPVVDVSRGSSSDMITTSACVCAALARGLERGE